MKRLTGYLMALALTVFAASCLKPESERMPEVLQISAKNTDKLNPFQAQISVTVKCDLNWKAELKDSTWGSIRVQSLQKGKGGEFVVLLKDNLAEEDRSNTIIVKAGKGETTLDFVQMGLASFFKPRFIQLEGTVESSVTFTSPAKWSAELPENPDWVKLTSYQGNSGYSRLACRANDENANLGSRETVARLTIGDYTFDIPVVQGQKDIILTDGQTLDLGYKAQEFGVLTQFNVDYTVEVSGSWITCITTKAPLNERVERFVVEENSSEDSRTAVISFKGGKAAPVQLIVEQEGKDRVLNCSEPGVYDLEGKDYLWGVKGWNQRSLLLSPDGTYRLRLLSAEALSAVDIIGFRFDYPEGEEQPVQVRIRRKDFTPFFKDSALTLLNQEGNLYWFKETDGIGIIVEK